MQRHDPSAPRILVVENDAGMRRYLCSCLEPLAARIVEVCDGREALDFLAADGNAVDLIVSDVVMPRLDGHELARRIGQDPALAALPVLLVTGDSGEAERSQRPVLRKPFSGSLLRAYVEELLKPTETEDDEP